MTKRTAEGPRTNAESCASRRMETTGKPPWWRTGLGLRCLAYTCGTCGQLVTRRSIRLSEPASEVVHECRRKARRARDHEFAREHGHFPSRPRKLARNQQLRVTAKRHGQNWTGPELELAGRKDLSASQVGEMLGRTLKAVEHIRARLEVEPKLQRLAHGGSPTP